MSFASVSQTRREYLIVNAVFKIAVMQLRKSVGFDLKDKKFKNPDLWLGYFLENHHNYVSKNEKTAKKIISNFQNSIFKLANFIKDDSSFILSFFLGKDGVTSDIKNSRIYVVDDKKKSIQEPGIYLKVDYRLFKEDWEFIKSQLKNYYSITGKRRHREQSSKDEKVTFNIYKRVQDKVFENYKEKCRLQKKFSGKKKALFDSFSIDDYEDSKKVLGFAIEKIAKENLKTPTDDSDKTFNKWEKQWKREQDRINKLIFDVSQRYYLPKVSDITPILQLINS